MNTNLPIKDASQTCIALLLFVLTRPEISSHDNRLTRSVSYLFHITFVACIGHNLNVNFVPERLAEKKIDFLGWLD